MAEGPGRNRGTGRLGYMRGPTPTNGASEPANPVIAAVIETAFVTFQAAGALRIRIFGSYRVESSDITRSRPRSSPSSLGSLDYLQTTQTN